MNESHVPPTTLPGGEVPSTVAAQRSAWTGGRIAALVIGGLLVLLSLALLAGAGIGVWAKFQRDAGYVTTGAHQFSTSGSALATEKVRLGSSGVGWLYAPTLLGKIRIRVTPASPGRQVFVGIGRTADVDRYLAGVQHTVITDYWEGNVEPVGGGRIESAPGEQHFWVASTTGSGPRTLIWDPANGSWRVVVMNARGQPGLDVRADLGARVPALPWVTIGFFAAGAVFLAGGALLILGAVRRRAGRTRV